MAASMLQPGWGGFGMAEYDHGFKIVAHQAGPGLTRMAQIAFDAWEPISDTLQTTERLADRAFRARHGQRRFIVYMEAYTRWVESAPWSILAKSGLLSERERLPTRSLLFILLPEGYRPQNGVFRLEAEEGEPTQQVWFHEIRLWEQVPQAWWMHFPGLMALYPLCRHEQEPVEAIAHAAAAIRAQELDSARRADLLTVLSIFGKLKHQALDVFSIIGREQMRESAFYQELAVLVGQEQARKDILQVLQLRFGEEAAQEFAQALNGIEGLERLDALLKLAVTTRRVSQFRRALPQK
jgi:hypothetical protein